MKKLLPVFLIAAGSSVTAAATEFAYNSRDGSCMSRPYACEYIPTVSEDEAYRAVGDIDAGSGGDARSLIPGETDIKVNGESCYSILSGEQTKNGFDLATTYAVGMHSGTVYRYDIVSRSYHPVILSGNTVIDSSVFNMIPVNPDTRFLVTPEGKIPFVLKFTDSSIVLEAADKHWSQKFNVPVVKADFWEILFHGRIFIAFSMMQSDFKEDSAVLELTPQGFKNAGFFTGMIKQGAEGKIYFTRRISMGNTIWEGNNYAEMTDGIFSEETYFYDLTDTYRKNSRLKLNHNLRLKKADLQGTSYSVNGYSDEKAGSTFIFERFYPNPESSLIENVSEVYYTIQDGAVILKSADTGELMMLDHTVQFNPDDGPVSVLEGVSFDELFTIE